LVARAVVAVHAIEEHEILAVVVERRVVEAREPPIAIRSPGI
jgi:hypothetical protein